MTRKRVSLAGTALAVVWSAPAYASDETTLRIHHFLNTESVAHSQLLEPWAERVAEASDGRLSVEVYPSMQLGGAPPDLYDQVRDGIVDAAWTVAGYTPGRFPNTEVFELPFMPSTAEATSRAIQSLYEDTLNEDFQDVHVLMLHVHAPGTIHTRTTAVETLDDLEGLQLRAPSRVMNDALETLGATAVGMPVPELPEALSRGVVDGAVIPYEVAQPLRVHELVEHHTEVMADRGLYSTVFIFAMNADTYDSLDPELRAVIDVESGESLAAQAGRIWDAAEEPGRAAAEEHGNTIHRLDEDEVNRWIEASQPAIDAWIDGFDGGDERAQALYDEARERVETFTTDID